MAQYEVVTSPGEQFPVGFVFESDALHPVMQQHVKVLRGKKVALLATENTEKDEDGPKPEDLIGADYVDDADEAFELAAAEYAERSKPKETVKPAVKTPAKTPKNASGPGANS